MSDESTRTPGRIAYRPGYLVAVLAMVLVNLVVFYFVAKNAEDPNSKIPSKEILSAFFGVLFAGGCNLTALALARWTNRRGLADRILLFLLIELLGLTLMVLTLPRLAQFFWSVRA